ncbi:MAG: C40 family peptidase, partial [Bacteroidota bacterium]|nr:C40 family peptidase [Bacteroidota bacterium]
ERPSSEGPPKVEIQTRDVNPVALVDYAKTLIGVPYKYGSMIRKQGFDCSGFINYVFHHFDISTPRSSVDFTDAGTEVPLRESRPGDLILFTGTDTTGRVVGHMGIITGNHQGEIQFIHSSSGKHRGVIISALGHYYLMRFVKVIRVFPYDKEGY